MILDASSEDGQSSPVPDGEGYYRCTYGSEYARSAQLDHPKVVYVHAGERPAPHLDAWLGRLFDPDNVDETCGAILSAATANASNDAERAAANEALRACDQKLDRYRQLLDTGTDAALVAGWINDVQAERRQLEPRLRALSAATAADFATAEEIRRTVEVLGGMVGLLKVDAAEAAQSLFTRKSG